MHNKFLLHQLNENGEIEVSKEMKTLKEIANLLHIEYHQARQLYLHFKNNTKAHPFLKHLSRQFMIIDNPRNHIIVDLN
jgi:hypothetical protein